MNTTISKKILKQCDSYGGKLVFVEKRKARRSDKWCLYHVCIYKNKKWMEATTVWSSRYLDGLAPLQWEYEIDGSSAFFNRIVFDEELYKKFLLERTMRAL